MPATEARTEQVYVTLYPVPIGPAVGLHVTPLTPAIDHVPVPVGVGPVVGPETVAVKVNVEPRETLEALVVTTTLGFNLVISTPAMLLGPAAR